MSRDESAAVSTCRRYREGREGARPSPTAPGTCTGWGAHSPDRAPNRGVRNRTRHFESGQELPAADGVTPWQRAERSASAVAGGLPFAAAEEEVSWEL